MLVPRFLEQRLARNVEQLSLHRTFQGACIFNFRLGLILAGEDQQGYGHPQLKLEADCPHLSCKPP